MSLFVVGAYVLVVGGASALLGAGTSGDLAVSILATGLIAAGFQPLRQAVQRAVNRRLYGSRDEPMAVVAALGDKLEAGDSDAALLASIAETVTGALRLPYAEITQAAARRPAASCSPGPSLRSFRCAIKAKRWVNCGSPRPPANGSRPRNARF